MGVDSYYTYSSNPALVSVATQFIHPANPFANVTAMMLAMHFNNDKDLLVAPKGRECERDVSWCLYVLVCIHVHVRLYRMWCAYMLVY